MKNSQYIDGLNHFSIWHKWLPDKFAMKALMMDNIMGYTFTRLAGSYGLGRELRSAQWMASNSTFSFQLAEPQGPEFRAIDKDAEMVYITAVADIISHHSRNHINLRDLIAMYAIQGFDVLAGRVFLSGTVFQSATAGPQKPPIGLYNPTALLLDVSDALKSLKKGKDQPLHRYWLAKRDADNIDYLSGLMNILLRWKELHPELFNEA